MTQQKHICTTYDQHTHTFINQKEFGRNIRLRNSGSAVTAMSMKLPSSHFARLKSDQ